MKHYFAGWGRGSARLSERAYVLWLLQEGIQRTLQSFTAVETKYWLEMKLFFAGAEHQPWEDALQAAKVGDGLYSYFYLKERRDYENLVFHLNVFMDSGAFTAYTLGKRIELDEYCAFLEKYASFINIYAALDVIGDWNTTLRNFREMQRRNLKPLWTFHFSPLRKAPYDLLKEVVAEEEYIALGGMATKDVPRSSIRRHLDRCFDIIGQFWPRRVHGFGVSSVPILERYPFYSVDSTSWLSGAKTGTLSKFEGGRFVDYRVHDKHDVMGQGKIEDAMFMDSSHEDKRWMDRLRQSIRAYMEMEEYITRLWEKRGIKFPDSTEQKS